MSANQANKALSSARKQKASHRRPRNKAQGGSRIQGLMRVPLNPNREFHMDLRLGEWTVYLDNTSPIPVLQNNPIQGFTTTPPWQPTVAASDSYPSTYYVLFQSVFSLANTVTRLSGFFGQFQIRAMEWRFEALVADSWNVGGFAQVTGGLACSPELLIVSEPTTQSPPSTCSELLGYSGCERKVLSPGKVATFGCLPRPQMVLEVNPDSPAAATAAMPANVNSLWYYTGANVTFCGPLFAIRSWYTEQGMTFRGAPPIRISPRMRVAFRQPID